ncbi:dTDP-4-amino-4,6-dideoxygalactose transaminase [Acinetobacter bereziniae]|uniref:dTDP-4-amino-4,6-dideoxygalactose transaminase n=1 Tax=Acinetobacter bereziniae TaxID=106648 RepID=UPI0021D03966|nr:dTDP-4-amino-4,6-dideoxygalactose transaminase [Acinetobacter bereziniae]MCU4418138.1 dTDP-4-amino-4,6-dideoxygalactose transaminase [Acinetobacter bereziniae]
MLPFNKPPYTGNEDKYVLDVMHGQKMSGDGVYTKKCHHWFEEYLSCEKALLTPSCTHALELAAILIDIKIGDEVIMPSYTFVSTANAFLLRGAKIVFVDIRPDTMNIDEEKIEEAITTKTKAIVPVHYAGVACEMDKIMELADRYNLYVIEDAAQGMMSTYNGKKLGTIGHLAAYSFHDTKNYTSGGEGGLLIINDTVFSERAEIIREKGTNRSQFFRGMVDKYTWTDIGSSYLPSELQAAYLWGQLENVDLINRIRLENWKQYYLELKDLEEKGFLQLPSIPNHCEQNAHMFYIKVSTLDIRTKLIDFLSKNEIVAVFHYVPLHNSEFGKGNSIFIGDDHYTTQESEKIIRLPMWYGLSSSQITSVTDKIIQFFYRVIYEN